MIPPDPFYIAPTGALRQGDILLAGVSRLVAEDRFTPDAWESLDGYDLTVRAARDGADLRIAAGPALTMVTSHDCHFDKDWNITRRELIRAGVDEDEASHRADADPTLDRTFTASPLVNASDIDRDQAQLRAGRILGYFPVPESGDGLVPASVVDLTYRVTLDRLDVVRIATISAEARMRLRYGLAHLDSLRATTVGFELEHAVGRQIEKVSFPKHNRLMVRLHLDDGSEIDLLQQPAEPDDAAPARTSLPSGPTT